MSYSPENQSVSVSGNIAVTTAGTTQNMASLTLGAGKWIIEAWGTFTFVFSSTAIAAGTFCKLSVTSSSASDGTLGQTMSEQIFTTNDVSGFVSLGGAYCSLSVSGTSAFVLTTSTTIHLTGAAPIPTSGSTHFHGTITARQAA